MSKVTPIPKHTVFGEYITLGPHKIVRVSESVTKRLYEAMCTCGAIKWLPKEALMQNQKGCMSCTTRERATTHNLSKTKLYKVWICMKQRCSNPSFPQFKDYGGRGIGVSKSWENSFETFISDMGPKPTPKHTIERIDNNKGYDKSNCRWATMKEQHNNTSRNVVLSFMGIEQNVTQWGETLEMDRRTISSRIKRGWSVERTLTTPIKLISAIMHNNKG